ncbi:MAG TPA: hypothetical protein DFS52_07550, partial [Myxococcales bacterium]|nr:hypothetical protein [Myxococcales bacterium]
MAFDFDGSAAKMSADTKDKPPARPPDVLALEASRAYSVAKLRRDEIAGILGFEIRFLDDIPEIVEVLVQAHQSNSTMQDQKSDLSLAPSRTEADDIIARVMRAGRYVYRHRSEVQKALDRIGDVGAMPDRVGDLRRVAFLCEENPELITADARIPANVVERARELATKLSSVVDDAAYRAALARRNLAYWMLDEAVGELRAAVRFAFPEDTKFISQVCARYEPP